MNTIFCDKKYFEENLNTISTKSKKYVGFQMLTLIGSLFLNKDKGHIGIQALDVKYVKQENFL